LENLAVSAGNSGKHAEEVIFNYLCYVIDEYFVFFVWLVRVRFLGKYVGCYIIFFEVADK
jgi:hypothetical protein